jgi:hypothetical protein
MGVSWHGNDDGALAGSGRNEWMLTIMSMDLLVVPDRRIAQEDDVGKESIQRYLRLECVVQS